MLSESDQLVSQTSHHVTQTPIGAREIEEQKPSYLQRMITRSKQQLRSPEGQQISTPTPEESVVDNSKEFPAIQTAYYFADYILSSEKASSETLVYVDTIQQVRQGIREATRLHVSPAVSNFLDAYPNKRTWAMECLQEAQQTLNDIGTDMDSTWGREEDGGTVASKLKFEWGLKNQRKLLKRQQQLNQCHINLMGAIHVMQTAELCNRPGVIIQEPIYEAPVRPLVIRDESDTFRGPYSRQKHRLGYNYASISSLTLALENDEDDVETASINSTPVELAGSTPSELSESQNIHDVLIFQTSQESLTESQSLFRRPRASSDHVRQTAIGGVRSRASIDTMIVHNDLIPFTAPATGIPMIARRGRASSVDIQSHNKYQPRAQRPPTPKNQASLDDAAGFALPTTAIKRLPVEEWAALPTRSGTMAMSDIATNSASWPIKESGHDRNTLEELPPSHEEPENAQTHGNSETVAPSNTRTNPESYTMYDNAASSTTKPPSYPSSLTSKSQPSTSSLTLVFLQDEGSVCRPSSQRPSQRKSKNTPNTSGGRPESTTTSREIQTAILGDSQLPVESSSTNKQAAGSTKPIPRLPPLPMIVIDDACLPILATETELPEDVHDENSDLSAIQQRLQGEVETNPVAERRSSVRQVEGSVRLEQPKIDPIALKDLPSSHEELEPLAVPTKKSPTTIAANHVSASRSNESQEDLVGKKPMSAQAKRRAAHARRMHLAFGNVANT